MPQGPAAAVSAMSRFRLAEVAGVDRHRLCPAVAEDHQKDQSHRIQVLERIECQASEVPCGRIAAAPCHPAVRGFVQGECQEHDRQGQQERENRLQRISALKKCEEHSFRFLSSRQSLTPV